MTEIEFIQRYYHPDLTRPEKTFGQLGEKWQYEKIIEPFFNPLIRTVYNEMPRDWDKTGLVSACAFTYCYFHDNATIRSYAADRDQAQLIMNVINRKIILHHPELTGKKKNPDINIKNWEIVFNNKSILVVEAADAASAFGKAQDFAIVDELHCWQTGDSEKLFYSIITKRGTKLIVTTNPGARRDGLCWQQREIIRKKYEKQLSTEKLTKKALTVFWFSAESNPFEPTWLDEKTIREESTVPEGVFRRLHLCKWGEGGDLFTQWNIDRCHDPNLNYLTGAAPAAGGIGYGGVLAIDFGLTRDWTAAAIVGRGAGENELRILARETWKARGKGDQIKIENVEKYIESSIESFGLDKVVIERWEMAGTIQRLKGKYGADRIIDFVPTESSVVGISKSLYLAVSNGLLRWPASDTELESEFLQLEVSEGRGSNWKIVYNRRAGGHGHGDVTRAVSIAVHYAQESRFVDWENIIAGLMGGPAAGSEIEKGLSGDRTDYEMNDGNWNLEILPGNLKSGGDWD